jgi:sulfatase modifying factor 1
MKAENFIETLPGGVSFEMVFVEGGRFLMGSEEGTEHSKKKTINENEVKVSDFFIGKFPVTQELWKSIIKNGNNPSQFKGDKRPIENVSWNETKVFFKNLNKLVGKEYRLLSEAEWEYAARGGKKSQGFKYAGSNKIKDVGWYEDNSHGETKPVGLKYPNELGIYDMSGNVYEWVEDKAFKIKNSAKELSSRSEKLNQAIRILKGGGWINPQKSCLVYNSLPMFSNFKNKGVGFRIGLSY